MTEGTLPIEEIPASRSLSGTREPVLYHYTTYPGLAGIVESKALWCTKVQYLNDSSELKHGFEILARECAKIQQSHPEMASVQDAIVSYRSINCFTCSFTEKGDLLSQWRGYSGGGGVAIEFSYEKIKRKALDSGFVLRKCIYDDDEKTRITLEHIERILSQQTGAIDFVGKLLQSFLSTALLFKNDSFSEENEWRLASTFPVSVMDKRMRVRSTQAGLIPFLLFDLATGDRPLQSAIQPWRTQEDICVTGVTIGPHREQTLQMDAVGVLFDTNGAHIPGIGRSSIPFRQL